VGAWNRLHRNPGLEKETQMTTTTRALFGRLSGPQGLNGHSLKQLVAWGDHLKVDQAQLDAQHEAIFKIAMEVADTWQNRGDLDRLKALTEKLAHVLGGHFRYEELQLAEAGYPKLGEHKAEHQVMLDELQIIRERLDRMKPGSSQMWPGFIVHNYVLGVTVGHICHSDMDYCAHARQVAGGQTSTRPNP